MIKLPGMSHVNGLRLKDYFQNQSYSSAEDRWIVQAVLVPSPNCLSSVVSPLQVGEAVLENARLMLHTENIQACAEDFKDR